MTPWQWWAADEDDACCGEWNMGEFSSRAEAIAGANRELPPGTPFRIIEARSSESLQYEGADIVPFLRSRNQERLVTGPRAV